MKSHRLPILLLAAAAASASGAAGAVSFSYQGLNYSDANCTTGFSIDASTGVITCTPPTATPPITPPATPPITPPTAPPITPPTASPPTGDDTLCTQANLKNTVMPLGGADWLPGFNKDITIGQNQSVSFPLMLTSASSGGRVEMPYTSGGSKIISISQSKCDFAPSVCLTGGDQPTLTFRTPTFKYPVCKLTAGVQYYVNVRNAVMDTAYAPKYPIVDSCVAGECVATMSYSY